MLKQRLWLALVGLAAGVVLAYLQIQQCGCSRKRPSASRTGSTADSKSRRLLPPARVASPTAGTRSVIRKARDLQPAAPFPSLGGSAASPMPEVPGILSSVLPAEGAAGVRLPLPDDGKLWSARFGVGLDKAEGAGGMLDFLHQKTGDDSLPMIDLSNVPGLAAGCRLMQNDDTMFRGRLGGGFSREYRGLAEGQLIPEVLLGVQLAHQVSQRNKILGAVEYAQDVTEFGRYRVRTQAAWEVLLDPEKNLSLRTGILESSHKAPKAERVYNLDYSVNVIWKF